MRILQVRMVQRKTGYVFISGLIPLHVAFTRLEPKRAIYEDITQQAKE